MYEFLNDYALILGWFSVSLLLVWCVIEAMGAFLLWRHERHAKPDMGNGDSLARCNSVGCDDRVCSDRAELDLPKIDERI